MTAAPKTNATAHYCLNDRELILFPPNKNETNKKSGFAQKVSLPPKIVLMDAKQPLSKPYASSSKATVSNFLPSSISRLAPPPVET